MNSLYVRDEDIAIEFSSYHNKWYVVAKLRTVRGRDERDWGQVAEEIYLHQNLVWQSQSGLFKTKQKAEEVLSKAKQIPRGKWLLRF